MLEIDSEKFVIENYDDLELVIEKHRELWNWVAENPRESKILWDGWRKNNAVNWCFACEIMGQSAVDVYDMYIGGCEGCIFNWNSGFTRYACEKENSPYYKWKHLFENLSVNNLIYEATPEELEELSSLAREIRDLPINKDIWGDYFGKEKSVEERLDNIDEVLHHIGNMVNKALEKD